MTGHTPWSEITHKRDERLKESFEARPMYRLSDVTVYSCVGCGAMILEGDRTMHLLWHDTCNDWFERIQAIPT